MVNRWRRTASVSVEGLNAVIQEIEEEERLNQKLEDELRLKTEQLSKMWSDSKVIKAAINMLEQKVFDAETASSSRT